MGENGAYHKARPENKKQSKEMGIGKRIEALRVRRGVTQKAMAQRPGVSPRAVGKRERAVRRSGRQNGT